MTSIEISDSSRLTGEQPYRQQLGDDEDFVTVIIYDELSKYHLERRALGKEGKLRPAQSLKNERSAIDDWIAYWKLSPSDTVTD